MSTTDLDFPAGSHLTRYTSEMHYDRYGERIGQQQHTQIGPCSIVDTHGTIREDEDGHAKWVGTIDVQAPPESEIGVGDTLILPNGAKAIVIKPPERPRNPFTGWTPFIQFTLASPGYKPAQENYNGM